MNENNPNYQMLQTVARLLGPLNKELVYVGGCAVGLLITDEARPEVRATQDVDLIAEVATVSDYYALCEKLKAAQLNQAMGDISCRWRSAGGVIVDVMPTDPKILGYTNRWFLLAMQNPITQEVGSDLVVKIAAPPLLVASKLDAFYGRGNGDFRMSHDIEDVINLVDGRPELAGEIGQSLTEVKEYLRDEFDALLARNEFTSAIPFHFNPDPANQARVPLVLQRLREIAGL